MPFSVHRGVDHPLSLYAASKRANELMAHTYSSLFGLPTTGLRFAPRKPPDGDFAAFVSRSVSSAPYAHHAEVILHASVERASERIPPAAGKLVAVDEGSCLLETGASSLDTLSVYLALIGFEFEVRKPPELIEHIRSLAERFDRAAR